MTITFFINYLNHHQAPVADELYKILGNDFHFVATLPYNPSELKGGEDFSQRPYCILASTNSQTLQKAHELNITSDVCVYGANSQIFMKERAMTGKLAFEIGERWLKKGWVNILSPNLIKWWWLYQRHLRTKPFYKLCASAYAATDDVKLLAYKNKHFKWGYFTKVEQKSLSFSTSHKILWCGRFLSWKHPELPVLLAQKLKNENFDFRLDMVGNGEKLQEIKDLATALQLNDVVTFHDNLPNSEVLDLMQESQIFLLTSDQNEGWGAVANEAMAQGCVLVGSHQAGSIPYLIKDGVNGLIFESNNLDSLFQKVAFLLKNPQESQALAQQGYLDITQKWSPRNAAENLVTLSEALLEGKNNPIESGPCSKS